MGALEKERSFFEGKKKKRSVQHTKWNTPKIEKTKLVVDEREVDEFLQTEKIIEIRESKIQNKNTITHTQIRKGGIVGHRLTRAPMLLQVIVIFKMNSAAYH